MDGRQETNGLRIPAPVAEAWSRLRQGGGSRNALENFLTSLAKAWAFEPDRFDRWLRENHHVERKDLPPIMLVEFRQRYQREQTAKETWTRDTIHELANGPHLIPLIEFGHAFSDELKTIVFRVALATPHNEDYVFVLSMLSLERPAFVQECIADLPDSPLLQTFAAYTKKTRLPLAIEASPRPTYMAENAAPVDRLLDIATRPWETLSNDVQNLPSSERDILGSLAERLFQRLSEKRTFEAFVKANLSVFTIAARPDSQIIPSAVQLLVSLNDPAIAELLAPLGRTRLVSELYDLKNSQPGHERFLASVIDSYRRHFSESISDVREDLLKIASRRQPLLELAAGAALLQANSTGQARFERLLLRTLRKDKENQVREWIVRNPEFARYFRAEKASLQTLSAILDDYRTRQPRLASRIAGEILGGAVSEGRHRYWEEALRVLADIGGDDSDTLFSTFITTRLTEDPDNTQVQQALATKPGRILLRRNFWRLLDTPGSEPMREILFSAYALYAPESELAGLLETAYLREPHFSSWIIEQLTPSLVEKQSLSPTFLQYLSNRDLLLGIVKTLARRAAKETTTLREMTGEWTTARDRAKRRLLTGVERGLRIAIENTLGDSRLRAQISNLSRKVQEWASIDSPKIEVVISSYASTSVPAALKPDRQYLEAFFRERARGPNEFGLFVGTNPWAVDLIVADEQGPWPKTDLLLTQLVRTFVFVTQLRRQAEDQLRSLNHLVRVELAAILREALADIEADLAGYFIFRDMLDQAGLHPAMPKLGASVEEKNLSSQIHKVIRDPGRMGRLRVFGLGIQVDDTVVGSGTIMKSGGEDDRD